MEYERCLYVQASTLRGKDILTIFNYTLYILLSSSYDVLRIVDDDEDVDVFNK